MALARISTLFICDDDSARSRMAAAFLHVLGGGRFEAMSAGFESNRADPLAVDVMGELGITLHEAPEPHVFDRYLQGLHPEYVVRLIDQENGEHGPVFPGVASQVEWDVPDPARFQGTDAERRAQFVRLRDRIHALVADWIDVLEHRRAYGGGFTRGAPGEAATP